MTDDKKSNPREVEAHKEGVKGVSDEGFFTPQSEANKEGMKEKNVMDEQETRNEKNDSKKEDE